MPPRTTKRGTTTILKNKTKQPELTENQTAQKSDNQGDKEETFVQTGRRGRRGGDRQPGQMALVATRLDPGTGGLWDKRGRQCYH